ncbi:MORN repeat-containing protein 1 [Dromaius novaehollandiae]|uniref:MORN repeat-containing protein 1 n=1 Tax=Dromaius novaehollandiae TaxID=8790 RepID=UPI00311F8638
MNISFRNEDKCEGDWILDQCQGHGILHCADGTIYEVLGAAVPSRENSTELNTTVCLHTVRTVEVWRSGPPSKPTKFS